MVPAIAPVIARRLLLSGLLALSIWRTDPAPAQTGPRFTLPPGFAIDVFADGVGSIRLMALDPAGTTTVKSPERALGVSVTSTQRLSLISPLVRPGPVPRASAACTCAA